MLRKHIKVELTLVLPLRQAGRAVWRDMVTAAVGYTYAGVLPNLGIKVDDHNYSIFKERTRKPRRIQTRAIEMIDRLYNHTPSACGFL